MVKRKCIKSRDECVFIFFIFFFRNLEDVIFMIVIIFCIVSIKLIMMLVFVEKYNYF